MNKLKQNDLVVVLAGKDKGQDRRNNADSRQRSSLRVWHQYDQAAHKR